MILAWLCRFKYVGLVFDYVYKYSVQCLFYNTAQDISFSVKTIMHIVRNIVFYMH